MAKSKIYHFGADAGNSALKLAVEGMDEVIYIPSVYTEAVVYGIDDGEEESVSDVLDHLVVTITTPSIEKKQNMIIGEKVVRDGVVASYLPVGVKKSREPFPLFLTLTGLAAAAIKMNPGKKNIRIDYEGTITLPITQINQEEASLVESRLMGNHTVVVQLPDQEITVNIFIHFAKCGPEGAIAAYDLIYDFNGNVKNEVYLDSLIQYFDIGDGTTELPVTRGLKYEKILSRGLKVGVAGTLDLIMDNFNQKFDNYQLRSRRHAYQVLMDPKHKHHDEIKKIAEPYLSQLANVMATNFVNQLRNAQDVDECVGLGGGVVLVKDKLVPMMKERGYEMKILDNAVNATAIGALKYSLSPRFQQFKAKSQVAIAGE